MENTHTDPQERIQRIFEDKFLNVLNLSKTTGAKRNVIALSTKELEDVCNFFAGFAYN